MPPVLQRPTQIESSGRYDTRKIAEVIGKHKGYIWDCLRVESRRASSKPGDKERRRAEKEGQTWAPGTDEQHQGSKAYKVDQM